MKPSSFLICVGPEAVKVLQEGMKENLNDLYFMNGVTTDVFDIADVRVTRCGYTGEDGFEVLRGMEPLPSYLGRPIPHLAFCTACSQLLKLLDRLFVRS